MKPAHFLANVAVCALVAAAITRAYAQDTNCVPPPAGLVGWWTGDGTANDLATYNHGATNGGVSFQPGKVNLAFHLDGASGYILVPDSPNLELLSAATFAA